MIEVGNINYNSFDLITPPTGYKWGVSQVDGGQQALRGENIPITGRDGRLYTDKKKDEAKVMLYMIAKDEASLVQLKQTVFDRGLHDFTCSPSSISAQKAEVTDFKYSWVCTDLIKITVEITVPQMV